MTKLKGKTVLITGGASGIGKLMGELLLEKGSETLVIWDINSDKLEQHSAKLKKSGYRVFTYKVDVRNTEQVIENAKKVVQDVGQVDILINNAGVVVGKEFMHHTHEDIDLTMGVNATALMHIVLAFLPGMIERSTGHIVNLASAAAYVANPKMSVYAASKWAVMGWSETLRIELETAGSGIKVTTVLPYFINTGMFLGVKSGFWLPILDEKKVARKIVNAVENNKIIFRMPFLVRLTPFVKGILPARCFDWFGGKILGVYKTMNEFKGRQG